MKYCSEYSPAVWRFARTLRVEWAGDSDQFPPALLDAATIFAPVGSLVPAALAAVRKGGRVVCAGIHMSDIPSFPYALLWGERSIVSVVNLTRADGGNFMELAARIRLHPSVEPLPLSAANEALERLRRGTSVRLADTHAPARAHSALGSNLGAHP